MIRLSSLFKRNKEDNLTEEQRIMRGDRIENLSGTICYKDTDVIHFSYDGLFVTQLDVVCENKNLIPFMMSREQTATTLTRFLEDRPLPRTRQNIDYCLKLMGLKEYDKVAIIKATHGLCTDDCYWIRFEGETITYDDIKVRD